MGVLSTETCTLGNGVATNKDKHITETGYDNSLWIPLTCSTTESSPSDITNSKASSQLQKEPAGAVDKGDAVMTSTGSSLTSFSLSSPEARMHRNGHKLAIHLGDEKHAPRPEIATDNARPPLVWDWTIEHADRKKERKADAVLHGATPFEVDRRVLKDVVREKMDIEVGRITFLSAGTFHKAYLVTLVNHVELVARVARRFMPRLKTESEVATINYLRQNTSVPVPNIFHYDSNPYNRLGGEFILMSKASGIPLSQVYQGLPYNDLLKLLKNLATIVIPLFSHRFSAIGSLYSGPDPHRNVSSGAPTPKAAQDHYSAYPFSPTLGMSSLSNMPTPKASTTSIPTIRSLPQEFHVGPIISWPFFGSNRGELAHPGELNRGPWNSTESYLVSCAEREIQGVILENEGKAAPHRLHLDPDEINSSRHHKLRAVPGDESDDSDEWGLEESEDEWEGPGDAMYRDYRRMQRSTFLVAHMAQREEIVRKEMDRWMSMMQRLSVLMKKDQERSGAEEFGFDCHDLSLENVFVDEKDHTKITCIIDWESTTIRPLWACTHIPAFLQSSPFLSKLFREVVAQLPSDPTVKLPHHKVDSTTSSRYTAAKPADLSTLCREWLYYESSGARLRMAHRCAEWDGWEEGLVESILGPEEFESEWFNTSSAQAGSIGSPSMTGPDHPNYINGNSMSLGGIAGELFGNANGSEANGNGKLKPRAVKLSSKLPIFNEQEKEQMLDTTGDFCGGRGGELGRRLEAWLTVTGGVLSGRGSDWDVDVFDR